MYSTYQTGTKRKKLKLLAGIANICVPKGVGYFCNSTAFERPLIALKIIRGKLYYLISKVW